MLIITLTTLFLNSAKFINYNRIGGTFSVESVEKVPFICLKEY